MNNDRRKQLNALKSKIEELNSVANELKEEIEGIQNDEQEYYDNMPEAIQAGEKGDKAQAAIDAIQEMVESFDTIIYETENAIEKIETATE